MIRLGAILAVAMVDLAMLAAEVIDVNVILNVVMLLVAAGVALPILRSRRKDAIIKDYEAAERSKDARIEGLEGDLHGAQDRANACDQQVRDMNAALAAAQARYEEQSKYTAEGALTLIDDKLAEHRGQVAERHDRILQSLEANRVVLEAIAQRLERG